LNLVTRPTDACARVDAGSRIGTHQEAGSSRRSVFFNAKHKSQRPTVNVGMLLLMVVLGAGVVLGVPYLMNKHKGRNGKTFGQMLEDARKQRVGHVQ
jgi:hypothetical protein